MSKRRTRRGSIKHKILCILYNAPLLPRRQVHLSLTSRHDRNNDMLRDLVKLGLVGIKPSVGGRCCYLTDAGLAEMYRLSGITPQKDITYSPHRAARTERDLRIGQMVNVTQAAGCCAFEDSKPLLETVIAVMNNVPLLVDTEDNWSALRPQAYSQEELAPLLSKGIFYSSSVIKRALKRRDIKEPIQGARFTGVLLMEEDIFICYSVLNRMMTYDVITEKKACDYVLGLFSGYAPYEKYHEGVGAELPGAIVLANSIEMLPALATGYKGGINRSPKQLKYRRNYNYFSAKTKLFSSMFFFTADEYGVGRLSLASHLSRHRLYEDAKTFFEAHQESGFVFTGLLPCLQASHSSGAYAVSLPFYDVIQLYRLRSLDHDIIIFVAEGHEDYISLIFGHLLKGAFSFKGKVLHPTRYTIRGERIEDEQP